MAKILLAASPEARAILEPVLSGHELSCAETLVAAEQLLHERSFDLIICTVVFDESRMFDLLRLAKSRPQWRQIPFICARVRSQILNSPPALERVAFTSRTLGAAAFLDVADYPADPERGMREAIERLLTRGEAPAA